MKILYVDVDPLEYRNEGYQKSVREQERYIVNGLRQKHEVHFMPNLQNSFLKMQLAKQYDALITHLPYTSRSLSYAKSLQILETITRDHPRMKVIIYTGASPRGVSDDRLKLAGAHAVVRKTRASEDLPKLQSSLEQLLS